MSIFKKRSDNAYEPRWNGSYYELLSPVSKLLSPGHMEEIDLDINVNLSDQYAGIIFSSPNSTDHKILPIMLKNNVENKIAIKISLNGFNNYQIGRGDCLAYMLIYEAVNIEPLKVQLLTANATAPAAAHVGDAGYDLYSAHNKVIPAHGKGMIKTDIAVAIPLGWYGRVAPRSSVAWIHHIDVGAGVIDSNYRGNVGVVLFNHSDTDFEIYKGDRIAQLILEKCLMVPVEVIKNLNDSERGSDGFGSTGK